MSVLRWRQTAWLAFKFTVAVTLVSAIGAPAILYATGNAVQPMHVILAALFPVVLAPLVVVPLIRRNIGLHELRVELERLARTDTLTGLPNRRAFFERINALFARDNGAAACAVMMVDIDGFKRINDRYGHDGGDAYLRSVGDALRRIVIPSECEGGPVIGRLGGEEFAIAVPGADRDRATVLAERICSGVRRLVCSHEGEPISTTVSVGVALREPGESVLAAIKRADRAVYEAKRAGRNRWRLADLADVGPEEARPLSKVRLRESPPQAA